jgi:PPP family 3-phenylpropionic acid transporter
MNIIRIIYLLFYGIIGSHLPYYPLYLSSIGYSTSEIGFFVGLQGISVLVMPLISGFFSDTFKGAALFQKRLFTFGCFVFLTSIAFVESFLLLSIFSFLLGICMNPLFSLIDTWVMQRMKYHEFEMERFASCRVWGSIGFIVPTAIFWLLSFYYQLNYQLLLLLGSAFAFCLFLFLLNNKLNFPINVIEETSVLKKNPLRLALTAYTHKEHRPVFFATFCIAAAMGVYYSMFSLLLQSLHLTPVAIGIMYNLGVVAEVCFLFIIPRFSQRISLTQGITIATIATFLRFLILSSTEAVDVIAISQITHGFIIWGIAVLASMYISSIAKDENRYSLFSLYQMMQGGVARVVGAFLVPWLVGLFVTDPHAVLHYSMLVASLIALLGFAALQAKS